MNNGSGPVVKKFYRDFSKEEVEFIESLLSEMRSAPIIFPSHVIQRMIDRGLIGRGLVDFSEDNEIRNHSILNAIPGYQNAIKAFDEGQVYEISNEGLGRTHNPFRLVLAKEHSDGYTYFVKVIPINNADSDDAEVKILDVWKKLGKMPIYPPKHSIDQFVVDWDVIESLESFFYDNSEEESNSSLFEVM